MKSILDSLTGLQIASYRAYAQSGKFRRRLDQALSILREGLQRADDAYVSLSFGKDSAVVYDLAQQVDPDIQARFLWWHGETELLDNYPEVIEQWKSRGANLRALVLSRETLSENVPNRWAKLNAEFGRTHGYISGLRAEESRARAMTLRTQGAVAYIESERRYRICPLAWWTGIDVAAHVVTRDLPMLDSYHEHGLETRTASRIPRDHRDIRGQSLADLRMRDPESYRLLADRFPEISLT